MRGKLVTIVLVAAMLVFLALPEAHAFPDAEITGIAGGPPLSLGFTDNPTSFMIKDNGTMIVTYGQVMRIVDLGFFALATIQPIDPADDDDDENDSPFNAAYYDQATNKVYISQERGYVAIYGLNDLSVEAVFAEVADGKSLGPLVTNNTGTVAYITNNTDRTIHVFDTAGLTVTNTITVGDLPNAQSSYAFTDGIFIDASDEAWFTTDKGGVIVLPDGGTAVSNIIDIATLNGDTLPHLDVTSDDASVYVTNQTDVTVVRIQASSKTVTNTIDLNEARLPAGTAGNTALDGIVITPITNPTGEYAYVAGGKGVTVFDTGDDDVKDMVEGGDSQSPLPVSATPKRMNAGTDGYVYMDLATTEVGIISENPWVSVDAPVYSGGGSSLGAGESFDLTFRSNKDGTWEIRVGGDVNALGSLLVDINGDSSGNCVADEDVTLTIPYDENSALFAEGTNSIFVIVTDTSNNRGGNGTTVDVDTPPDVVTLESTGFGNTRVYINFQRLTAEDMDHYNVYVDTDPDAVLTKEDIGAEVAQPGGGSSVTGKVSGLENGTLYYIAVEAVDAGGNISATRANTLPDGSLASALPQETVGPAGFSGEQGCTLTKSRKPSSLLLVMLLCAPIVVFVFFRVTCHGLRVTKIIMLIIVIAIIVILGSPHIVHAQEQKKSPQWWSFEIKSGFWIPTNESTRRFFGDCCNVITRMQGGLLIHGRYGIEQGVGFMYKSGRALGAQTAEQSEDSFSLITMPMETNFAWRLDYFKWRYLIPYFKVGLDYTYFREDVQGDTTQGIKWGWHGVGGFMISLSEISDNVRMLDKESGINDMHFTLEGQYQRIDDFGGKGLNLSGWLFSAGLLFVF